MSFIEGLHQAASNWFEQRVVGLWKSSPHLASVSGGIAANRKLSRARSRLGVHHHVSDVFQPEFVVHRLTEFLLAAEITFGCLNRCVSK
jgi:hypothetical protein